MLAAVELKESHSKVRSIEYNKFETQRYLTSPIFSNEDVALRSRALNCKANFKNKYKETGSLCPLCSREEDTQQHMMLRVKSLKSEKIAKGKTQYDHIYKDEKKQKEVTELFNELIEVKNKLEVRSQDNFLTNYFLSFITDYLFTYFYFLFI